MNITSSKLNNFGVVCPNCFGEITVNKNIAICNNCDLQFPIVKGIIDLRISPNNNDLVLEEMLRSFDNSSFEELIAIMLSNARLPPKIVRDTQKYYKEQIERAQKMTDMFLNAIRSSFGNINKNRALDLGCGSGPGVFVLSKFFSQVIGLDTSIPQLLLALKTLHNHRENNFLLICANANQLPFNNESIDYIQSINVFEHLINLPDAIKEISRTLNVNGSLSADSRNRYDVFLPEPHTGIRFLGFLPRNLIKPFVNQFSNIQYENTKLLSYRELKHNMERHFQGNFLITFPQVQVYGKPSWIDKWISKFSNFPFGGNFLLRIFPTHMLLGRKSGEQNHES